MESAKRRTDFSSEKKNRATVSQTRLDSVVVELPSEVSKRFVRISHSVDVFPSSNRGAFFVVGSNEFVSKFQMSRSAFLFTQGDQDPAECQ